METMEQTLKKLKENYWITEVEFPQRRGELILTLRLLSNTKWQEVVYTSTVKSFTPGLNGEYGIHYTLHYAIDLIFNTMSLDKYIKDNEHPIEQIGWWLKSKKEAEYLFKVAILINQLFESINPHYEMIKNEQYLASPYLHKLRKMSKEALDEFMNNEKDNKELIEYINQANNDMNKNYIKLIQSNDTSETRI